MAQKVRDLFKSRSGFVGLLQQNSGPRQMPHMMDKTHIRLYFVAAAQQKYYARGAGNRTPPKPPALGVAVEGSAEAWPGGKNDAVLPSFDNFNRQTRWLEVFNKGKSIARFSPPRPANPGLH